MSATIDRYLQKLTLLGDKVDLLSKDYVLAALLPHPTMVKIDNIRAQFLNFQTTLPDTLSLARKEYFDQGAMKYSTNEWLKVGLLLDEIEMTLNNLIGVGNKILQFSKQHLPPSLKLTSNMSSPATQEATQADVDRLSSSITLTIGALKPEIKEFKIKASPEIYSRTDPEKSPEKSPEYQQLRIVLKKLRTTTLSPGHFELLNKILNALEGNDESGWPKFTPERLKEISENLTTQKEDDKNVQKLMDKL
ncbi:hypothetical protein B0H65DRAFT_543728 [Neurospora tetraspora]|uniref:Uncharacterized protein n=1 Tax=Neurospora tetraspora TaxID=94610 RepID=A0AAE0JML0_9PEZI|nr:hypothetical protein B0H65DRAFT_543728 [Neurospora tetraspora]